jgi:5'-deoxynucleotidase YfbR-like HD superfamily hydrolase
MIDWETLRKAGSLRRYHSVPTIGVDTIAAHSFGVAMLTILMTNGNASLQLIKAALYHDLHETYTGDVPGPVKRFDNDIATIFLKLEDDFNRNHKLSVILTYQEEIVLSIADKLDGMLFCLEERRKGNRYMDPVFHKFSQWIKEIEVPAIATDCVTLHEEILSAYKQASAFV